MANRWIRKPEILYFAPLLVLLIILAACGGDDATSTPRAAATATTGPAATATPTRSAPPTLTPLLAATSTPVAQPTATPEPKIVTSTTKRLVWATLPLTGESNVPWNTHVSGWDKGHIYEWLIGIDQLKGTEMPGLATSWGVTPDGRNWHFVIRKGIQFHGGFGEMTPEDVKWSLDMVTDAPGAEGDETQAYEETIDRIEAVGDTVTIYQNIPEAFTIPFFTSGRQGTSVIASKAHWDAEGYEGFQNRMIGTGPYQFVSRVAPSLLVERVDNHWRKTPEFREFEHIFTPEVATREAMLFAGEAAIATLPTDLLVEAEARGMQIAASQLPASQWTWFFGGQYYHSSTPDALTAGGAFAPWVGENDPNATLVRQAMNKAVNRDEIVSEVYGGDATQTRVWAYHQSLPGFNPRWDAEWDAKYGYDVQEAKDLLTQAGYPNGFKVKVLLVESPSIPEQKDVGSIMARYFRAIGLDVEEVPFEGATYGKRKSGRDVHGFVFPVSGSYRDPQITIKFYNDINSVCHVWETDTIADWFQELRSALTPADRDRIMMQIGDEKYDKFAEIPFMWVPGKIAIDPKVIKSWFFAGGVRQLFSHIEYIEATELE